MTTKLVPLEDVATIIGGGTPSRSIPDYFGGDIPWVTPTDVTKLEKLHIERTKESITADGLNSSSAKLLPTNSVLLTSRATIGFVAVTTMPMATNQGFINFICKQNLLPEYLARWLMTQKDTLLQLAGGTTFKEVSKTNVRKLKIPLPPIVEQERIVDVLSNAAGIQRLRKSADNKLKRLAPSLFVEIFGNPVENPKRWPVISLNEAIIGGFKNGLYLPKEYYCAKDEVNSVEMVHMSDVFSGKVQRGNLKRVKVSPEQLSSWNVTDKDLLLARRSLNFDGAARTTLVQPSDSPLVFESSVIRLTPDARHVTPVFLHYYLNNESVRKSFIVPKITGSTIYGINQASLSTVRVYLPPLDAQLRFSEVVSKLDALGEIASKANTAVSQIVGALYNTMM